MVVLELRWRIEGGRDTVVVRCAVLLVWCAISCVRVLF